MTKPIPTPSRRILIEDEHLIAVHKRAGELVVADRFGIEKKIILHELGEYLRAQGHQQDASGRDLYPVHRLDRETSGVVLFAKHEEAHRRLSKLFESREMEKMYWAFAAGSPPWDYSKVTIPLSRAEGKQGRGRALVDLQTGKPAETEFFVHERFQDICWMEAYPRTGRLHQIRVHLRAIGHPLIHDSAYGTEGWKSKEFPDLKLTRTPLHARFLRFIHPFTEKPVELSCPLDDDMRTLLNIMRKTPSL